MCHRGRAGSIQFMAQIVQRVMIGNHVIVHTACDRDFIGQTPADNRRMVVVLRNQLFHLSQRIGVGFGHMLGDIRNFCPRHKTVFVAEVVEILRVLVMGQTHGVRTHVAQNLHIFLVLGGGQRIAEACAVLVPRRARKPDIFSVKPKARVGLEVDFAAAEVDCHGVTARQRRSHTI